jgi:hypothetical protein
MRSSKVKMVEDYFYRSCTKRRNVENKKGRNEVPPLNSSRNRSCVVVTCAAAMLFASDVLLPSTLRSASAAL